MKIYPHLLAKPQHQFLGFISYFNLSHEYSFIIIWITAILQSLRYMSSQEKDLSRFCCALTLIWHIVSTPRLYHFIFLTQLYFHLLYIFQKILHIIIGFFIFMKHTFSNFIITHKFHHIFPHIQQDLIFIREQPKKFM